MTDHAPLLTQSEEVVFQNMSYRKLERQLGGTYKNDKPWTILWTFLTLLLLFGLVAPNFVSQQDGDKRSFAINVNIRDLGFLSLMAVIITVTLVYTLTRVVVVVRWSLYWLLATLSVLYLWKREINLFSAGTPIILLVAFGIAEFFTFFIYFGVHYLYPPFITSRFFRERIGVRWWFGLNPVPRQHWTMTYSSGNWFEGRRTCTYRGETDADGLPHGFGNWLDDSFHGELLSGLWEHGEPVGPFRSREFGSGFAFESLHIGYVHVSDDSFTTRNYFPSQRRMPTMGVASVECSVAGGFFSHLPRAKIRVGPFCLPTAIASILASHLTTNEADEETGLIRPSGIHALVSNPEHDYWAGVTPHFPLREMTDILPHLKILYTEHPSSSLIITATRGRGVLVSGHSFNADVEPDRLIIDIVREGDASYQATRPFPISSSAVILETSDVQSLATTNVDILSSSVTSAMGSEMDETMQTDALGSSLLLARDEKGIMEGRANFEDDPDEDVEAAANHAKMSAAAATIIAFDDADDILDRPLLSMDALTAAAAASQANNSLAEQSLLPIGSTPDAHLYFDLTNISAATFQNQLLQQQEHLMNRPHSNVFQNSRILMSQSRHATSQANHFATASALNVLGQPIVSGPHLRVRDWRSTVDGHVEALLFFPGFNASLEHSLQRLGQFMAMGRFPPHIKPMVFSWPCAREATYLWAAETANSKKTHRALHAMLRGLQRSGIRDVHFLVHSLGAQVVLSALRDDLKSKQRSEVSKLFVDVVDPSVYPRTTSGGAIGPNGESTLRLRTLTLLNPDAPLSQFLQRDFKMMRRVCDHITVVGDRKDGALHWSELGNGFSVTMSTLHELFFGKGRRAETSYDEEGRLEDDEDDDDEEDDRGTPVENVAGQSIIKRVSRWWQNTCHRPFTLCCRLFVEGAYRPYRHGVDRSFSRVLTVGKNIFSLYVYVGGQNVGPAHGTLGWTPKRVRALFGNSYRHDLEFDGEDRQRRGARKWLDLDAIDTSSMETNVHQLRHAYFDLNKILVEDLHELIVTGKRAAERSLLLHREGNIFSFCQAPACVVNQ